MKTYYYIVMKWPNFKKSELLNSKRSHRTESKNKFRNVHPPLVSYTIFKVKAYYYIVMKWPSFKKEFVIEGKKVLQVSGNQFGVNVHPPLLS